MLLATTVDPGPTVFELQGWAGIRQGWEPSTSRNRTLSSFIATIQPLFLSSCVHGVLWLLCQTLGLSRSQVCHLPTGSCTGRASAAQVRAQPEHSVHEAV